MREKLLDPTGTTERAVDTTLAPRLRSLRGLTAGLLENGKPNAGASNAGVSAVVETFGPRGGPPPVVRVP